MIITKGPLAAVHFIQAWQLLVGEHGAVYSTIPSYLARL